MRQQSRQFVLVPIGAALLGICLTMVLSGTSYFIQPVTTELAIPRSSFLVHYSLFSLLSIGTVPLAGRLAKRIGARRLILFGGIWTALGVTGMAFSSTLWMFYLFAFWIGLTLFPATAFIAVVVINAWFVKHRGVLTGLVFGAGGVGGIISSAILPGFIASYGWRAGYGLIAGITAVMIVVVVTLFIRDNTPQERGLEPFGLAEQGTAVDANSLPGMTYRASLRTPQFWLLFVGVMLFFSLNAGLEHYPAYLVDNGMTPAQLASTMTIFYTLALGVLPLVGWIADRVGIIWMLVIIWVLGSTGWILLIVGAGSNALMSTGLFFLLAVAALSVPAPLLTQYGFGPRDYAGLYGLVLPAGTLGVALAAPFWGLAHDLTKTYTPALIAAPILLGLGFACAIIATRTARKRWVHVAKEPDAETSTV